MRSVSGHDFAGGPDKPVLPAGGDLSRDYSLDEGGAASIQL